MAETLETKIAKRRLGIEEAKNLKIDSFKVNHLKLKHGIYVSRKDRTKHGDVVTTFDIRVCTPYEDKTMDSAAMHTIEHLGAAYLRNISPYKDSIVYFGPMGCLTGFYLIIDGDLTPKDIWTDIVALFTYIEISKEVPGCTKEECGNYKFHNLEEAKKIANRYLYGTLYKGAIPELTVYPA